MKPKNKEITAWAIMNKKDKILDTIMWSLAIYDRKQVANVVAESMRKAVVRKVKITII